MPRPDLDDLLRRGLTRGDPLADALAEEVAAHPASRRAFTTGLERGLATVPDAAPAVRDLLGEMERVAASVDGDVLDGAARASWTIPFAAHALDVGAGALLRSYAPPDPAAVLVSTGQLTEQATRRLLDTARWLNAASLPGGLRTGRPGYVETGRVRLLHAVVRRAVRRRDPDGPLPLHQVDMARTWLDFTLVTPDCDEALGLGLTAEEQNRLYTYWRHLGALLGVDPDLLRGVVDRRTAVDLDRRIEALTGPPSADSRALTAAGLGALTEGLSDASGVPRRVAGPVVAVVARAMHGPRVADALGVPRYGPAHHLVPLVAAVLRRRRRRLRQRPAAWHAVVAANIEQGRRFVEAGELPAPELPRLPRVPRVPRPRAVGAPVTGGR
ncbi:oxygenase MpaB family protein [Kineococcus terrestris]|uniref:oxygenase MpaB family protein n=1 Tax=Kineococcus terrestris TaxID=2044856 RepID=UPI0034DB05B8